METINSRIKSAMQACNCSQVKLAEQLSVSEAHVSMICSGKRIPSDRTVRQIASVLHVSEGWLLTGEGEMKPARTRNQSIMLAINDILGDEDESFRKRWIDLLANLDKEDWAALEAISRKLLEKEKSCE